MRWYAKKIENKDWCDEEKKPSEKQKAEIMCDFHSFDFCFMFFIANLFFDGFFNIFKGLYRMFTRDGINDHLLLGF